MLATKDAVNVKTSGDMLLGGHRNEFDLGKLIKSKKVKRENRKLGRK